MSSSARVQGWKVERELVLPEHARVHALARQQHGGRLAEDHLERERRHRKHGWAMKGATEGARERSAGRLLRRHAVHRTPIAFVDQRHRDDLHEVVEMNPRQVLRARSDGPTHSQLERRQHLRQRAAGPTQHDAGSQQHDARAQPLGVLGRALPPPAQPRQEIVAAARRFRERFIAAVAVVADGAAGHEDARAGRGLGHGPHKLLGHRDAAAFEDGAAGGRPPAAHQRFARQIHDGVACARSPRPTRRAPCRREPVRRRHPAGPGRAPAIAPTQPRHARRAGAEVSAPDR